MTKQLKRYAPGQWAWELQVERNIQKLTGRAVILEDYSTTAVEQLNQLYRLGDADGLNKELNALAELAWEEIQAK